jgi:hypothetical protein
MGMNPSFFSRPAVFPAIPDDEEGAGAGAGEGAAAGFVAQEAEKTEIVSERNADAFLIISNH